MEGTDDDTTGYDVDDDTKVIFLRNSKFCLALQDYFRKSSSIQIAIVPQKHWQGYTIHVVEADRKKRDEMKQIVSNFMEKLFDGIQSKTFTDEKVKEWLRHPSGRTNHLEHLQKILDEKVHRIFTACEEENKYSLRIFYLPKELDGVPKSEELDKIIPEKISQEIISLPFRYEKSEPINKELEKLQASEEISASSVFTESKLQKITLFGYYKVVHRMKKELLNIIEKYQLITFPMNSFLPFQVEFLLKYSSSNVYKIAEKYDKFGVEISLKSSEFSAPQYLKDQIEHEIQGILSGSSTITFKSIELFPNIAQIAIKHLEPIARRYRCCIKSDFKHKSRSYSIPKALSSNTQLTKFLTKQSEQFLSSSSVFNRIIIANGSLEIRKGDIALQKVETIVIPTMTNGLKEGVIERANEFEYRGTYTDTVTDTKYTETSGGKLNCQRILFVNWIPMINDLQKSVEIFLSKSIEYAMKDQNPTSIAFAVSDCPTDEVILARSMINAAKQQLESKKLPLKISFILLPEQKTLHKEFFAAIGTMQDTYAYFDFSFTVIKTTILASDQEKLKTCQDKIENYFKRCLTSTTLADGQGVFQHWDQQSINAFYQYCNDKCVLPQIYQTKKELYLTGPINNLSEVKQKWFLLSNLNKTTDRPSSARPDTKKPVDQTKIYNVMISYCQQDQRKCQGIIDRFLEQGFSIWAEPIISGEERNTFSQMDKSDCILLCLSENSYESQTCEKETHYALQTGKTVFLGKVQNDPLIGWQRRSLQEKLLFQLFGSENHLDLEFGKLLLKILQCTKPGYASLLQQISGRLPLDNGELSRVMTIEQRRSIYDKKIQSLMKIGRIDEKEMSDLIEQTKSVINYNDEESTDENVSESDYEWLERWLRKPTNGTKQNLPPFAHSGDINDALFPMPDFILKNLNRRVSSFSSGKFGSAFEHDIVPRTIEFPFTRLLFNPSPVDEERTYGKCTPKRETFDGLSQIFPNTYSTHKRAPLPILPREVLSVNEHYFKSESNVRRTISQTEYERPLLKPREVYLKEFAQQMSKNAIEFEAFCSATL